MAKRKAPARRKKQLQDRQPAGGWWGKGPSPLERWPGVTIAFDAVWNPKALDLYGRKTPRWETRDGKYFFDARDAHRFVDFFPEYLRHHIGEFAGEAFELLDYQRLLLTMPLFGWKRIDNGRRRFRKLFAFLPKGAGKSPWGAGTGLELALIDGEWVPDPDDPENPEADILEVEQAAEVYAVAADKNQARVVFDNARIMVEESPDLLEMCEVLKDSIYREDSRSTYKVVSADSGTKHGFRPSGVVFDEFHAQRDRKLFEAYSKSMPKRRQPVMLIVSHAGDDDEGICFEEYELAKSILAGSSNIEDTLPVIFEATPDDDWTSPEVWRRVNPGHGITIQHDGIVSSCREAEADPRKVNDFLRFTLNRWVNQATAWIPNDWWDACDEPIESDEILRDLPCAAGLDLAQKWDLSCFCVVFRHRISNALAQLIEILADESLAPGEKFKKGIERVTKRTVSLNYRITVLPFFWIPEETMLEHEKKDGVPYSLWAKQGLVTPTEGNIIDYSRIFEDITETILPRFPKLKGAPLGYDSWTATDLATQLRDLANFNIQEVPQQFSGLSEAAQITEALIKGKRVRHGGHKLLRWNWQNATVKTDEAKRIKPIKPKNQSKRVDGVLAQIMATKMLASLPEPKRSKYSDPNFKLLVVQGDGKRPELPANDQPTA